METIGYVLIQGLWDRQTDAIINFKLVDADAYTYIFEPMINLLYQK